MSWSGSCARFPDGGCMALRVAFLTHEPFHPPSGGGSAEAPYLVRELRRRRHGVDLFCPVFETPGWVAGDAGIQVHDFWGWEMGRYTRLRTLKYLLYPWALAAQVRRVACEQGGARPAWDVLFAQHTISSVAAGLARRRVGGRLVFNYLDFLTGFMEAWPAAFTRTGLVKGLKRYELTMPARFGAEGVLTVSEPLADRLVASGCPRDRVRPLMYGYDSRLFRPGQPVAAGRAPVVVMHGSFDRHHLGRIAMDAVVAVHGARPEVVFRFVGKETANLTRFVGEARRRCPGLVLECPGFVPYEELPRCLHDAAVGIVPYEATEGAHCAFVAKAVEYLGCGLPVASTPLENLSRHFADEPAIRFSGFDGASLAARIIEWLGVPPALRVELGRAASARVAAELDWGAIARRAVDFVEQVGRAEGGRA